MSKYWNSHTKKKTSPLLYCAVASEIVLFNGMKGLTQDAIDKLWHYDDYPPSITVLSNKISVKNIKWYIRNYIHIDDVWNGDFLSGMAVSGNIEWRSKAFPRFKWTCNKEIVTMIKECPFSGIMNPAIGMWHSWNKVPAFYLKSSTDSISFMAGVLSSAKTEIYDGKIYASYSRKILPYLLSWGIPIEHQSPENVHNLVSPFWPAIFSKYMPNSRSKWADVKSDPKSDIYSSILWRMYVSNDISTRAMPFLKSRRWIYKNIGTVKDTEQMWLKMGLSQLDKRVRTAVVSWSKSV